MTDWPVLDMNGAASATSPPEWAARLRKTGRGRGPSDVVEFERELSGAIIAQRVWPWQAAPFRRGNLTIHNPFRSLYISAKNVVNSRSTWVAPASNANCMPVTLGPGVLVGKPGHRLRWLMPPAR